MKISLLCFLFVLIVASTQGETAVKTVAKKVVAPKALSDASKKTAPKVDKRAMVASQDVTTEEEVVKTEALAKRGALDPPPVAGKKTTTSHPQYHHTRATHHTKRTTRYHKHHHTRSKTTTIATTTIATTTVTTTTATTTEQSGEGSGDIPGAQYGAGSTNTGDSSSFQFQLTISNVDPSYVTPAIITNAVVSVITAANPSTSITSSQIIVESIAQSRRRSSTVVVQFAVATTDASQEQDVENSLVSTATAAQSLTQSISQNPGLSGASVSLKLTSVPPTPGAAPVTSAPVDDGNEGYVFPAGCPSANTCDQALDLYLFSKAYGGCDCGVGGAVTCDASDGTTECQCCSTLCSFFSYAKCA